MLSGRMTSKDATLTIELPESFRSASNPAVKFHITVPPGQPRPAGIVHVSWYGESGDEPLGAKRIPIRITRWLHPVIVPLTSSDGTVPRKVVIKPYDYPTRFQFGRVELWSSKNK